MSRKRKRRASEGSGRCSHSRTPTTLIQALVTLADYFATSAAISVELDDPVSGLVVRASATSGRESLQSAGDRTTTSFSGSPTVSGSRCPTSADGGSTG